MFLQSVVLHTVVGHVNSVPAGPPSKHKQCPLFSVCVCSLIPCGTHTQTKGISATSLDPIWNGRQPWGWVGWWWSSVGPGTGVGGRVIFPGKIRGVYSVDFVGTERKPLRPAETQWMERKRRGEEAAVCLLGIKSCQIHKIDKEVHHLHPYVGIQHPPSFPLMSQRRTTEEEVEERKRGQE